MILSPAQFLVLLIVVSVAARVAFLIARKARRKELADLARDWRMHYSPHDRFDLSDRVAQRFPLPGAAELKVADLIYGTERDPTEKGAEKGGTEYYRYIFAAEFTIGVTRGKHRRRRIATFREPKARSAQWSNLVLAPEDLTVLEQYRALRSDAPDAKTGGSEGAITAS